MTARSLWLPWALAGVLAGSAHASAQAAGGPDSNRIAMPGSPFGVAWGFLYGPPWGKAETFLPALRQMGAGCTKLYLIWNQVEPRRGRYDWRAVDAFLGQLRSPEEALIAVFSSSTWATRRPSEMLPPSPARNPEDYRRFIEALVRHCRGRVRYWQNDCEPNNPVYWSGTAQEFVAELKVFHAAVMAADPRAVVVCGGYDGLFNPPGMFAFPGQENGLAFFDTVLKQGAGYFDVFDLRLYADPYTIPGRVAYMRARMRALGTAKPILCTEYNGPGFFEFPANLPYVSMVARWASRITGRNPGDPPAQDDAGNPIAQLYEKRETLAPETQMFLQGCPKPLEDRFYRIQCRDLVMRNVLALSAGVQKTMFWDLWHDVGKRDDLMTLMYAKHRMLDYQGGRLTKSLPAADAFRRMTAQLRGVVSVRRIDVPERKGIYLFEVARRGRGRLYVVWERRNAFTGEDAPAASFEWPWQSGSARAVDALGRAVPIVVRAGRVSLPVSVTPIYLAVGE